MADRQDQQLISHTDMTALYNPAPDGIYEPAFSVQHRTEEYDETGFDALLKMQERHFWYRGRHRFLLHALRRHRPVVNAETSIIDLGGGCGGWVKYLAGSRGYERGSLSLADSSRKALRLASSILPPYVNRYHVDLMNLGWHEQFDMAFMLDVIEHLPDDREALRQAKRALKPGGLLFVTTPAFQQFWSYNDELASHLRRYTLHDLATLARDVGLQLLDARYFMFFLSPLYLLSRLRPGVQKLSDERRRELVRRQHAIPSAPVNYALTIAFSAETPLGHWLRFPWGTSALGIFQNA